MKLTLFIIAGLFLAASLWCARLTWIAGKGTGTGDIGFLVMYGLATFIAALIALALFIIGSYL